MKKISVFVFCLTLPFFGECRSPVEILDWKPGAGSVLEKGRLMIHVPEDRKNAANLSSFRLNLKRHAGEMVTGKVRVKSSLKGDFSKKDAGIQIRVSYRADDDSHDRLGGGFFSEKEFRKGILVFPLALDPHAEFCKVELGPVNCSGRVEFDLASLEFETLFRKENADWICEYSAEVRNRPMRRGVMSPIVDQANEENFKVLRQWNVNLMRLQLNTSDEYARTRPEFYRKFIDGKIENVIPQVLDLGAKYGIKIILDLHTVPGSARMTGESDGIYGNPDAVDEFIRIWTRIATKFRNHPALYGYDLINEPRQFRNAAIDYWTLQKRAAEAIRRIDPETPIYVESNMMDSPLSFYYLSPLKLKNIIYECHFYEPFDFTHFFIRKQQDLESGKMKYREYPGWFYGTFWGPDLIQIKKKLSYVRAFEARHQAKIFVGEFSAFACAPGAEKYLEDCIRVFEEYGWDWTYHAFREGTLWSVEHEGTALDVMKPAETTKRKTVLLNAFRKNQKECK